MPRVSASRTLTPYYTRGASPPPSFTCSFLLGLLHRFPGPQKSHVICRFGWFLPRNAVFGHKGARESLFPWMDRTLYFSCWGPMGGSPGARGPPRWDRVPRPVRGPFWARFRSFSSVFARFWPVFARFVHVFAVDRLGRFHPCLRARRGPLCPVFASFSPVFAFFRSFFTRFRPFWPRFVMFLCHHGIDRLGCFRPRCCARFFPHAACFRQVLASRAKVSGRRGSFSLGVLGRCHDVLLSCLMCACPSRVMRVPALPRHPSRTAVSRRGRPREPLFFSLGARPNPCFRSEVVPGT